VPWWRRDRALRRRDRDRIQIATLTEIAQLREMLSRAQDRNAGPVHPLLLQAVAAPGRDGDLLRLQARGVEFLAIVAPGTDSAESIWERAAGLAVAVGAAGRPVAGPHEVVQVAYRVFPDGLHAIGVAGRRQGELLAFVSTSLHPADQRAAVRRLDRAAPGRHSIMPLAAPAPFALLFRHHPVAAAIGTAAAGTATAATIVALQAPPAAPFLRPQPRALPTPAVHTARAAPAAPAQIGHRRHHRRGLRDNSRAGQLQRIHAVHASTPFTAPMIPAASPSPTGLLPPFPAPVQTPGRACVEIVHVKVCAQVTPPPVLRF
jgi:hypothetical protein